MRFLKNVRFSLCVLFILFPVVIWAQSDWQVEEVTASRNTEVNNPYIAVDVNGVVHLVYIKRQGRDPMYDIYYQFKSVDTWSDPIPVAISELNEGMPSIDVDDAGIAHIVFARPENPQGNQLMIYYWNSSTDFGDPIPIDDYPAGLPSINPYQPDITVEPSGIVHIIFAAFRDLPGGGNCSELYYTSGTASSFAPLQLAEPLDDNFRSDAPSIDVDENGKVGIAFSKGPYDYPFNEIESSIFYTSNVGGDFIDPVEVSVAADTINQMLPKVKVHNGAAYVFYPQKNPSYCCPHPGGDDLYYVKLDQASGTRLFPPVAFAQRVGHGAGRGGSIDYEPAAGADPAKIHVAYKGYFEKTKRKDTYWAPCVNYLVLNADDGQILIPAQMVSEGSIPPEIDVDLNGKAHITFVCSEICYATNAILSSGAMHIASVDVTTKLTGSKVKGVATVTVVDQNGYPVTETTVSGNWSGLTTDHDVFQTGPDGEASCNSDKVSKNSSGYFSFTVNTVSKDGWIYDAYANVEDSDSEPWNISAKNLLTAGVNEQIIPLTTQLLGNYPNPFNPSTTIRYQLTQVQSVTLSIYNLKGQIVRRLENSMQPAGHYSVMWDGTDEAGKEVASGIYLYRLKAGEFTGTHKMIMAR